MKPATATRELISVELGGVRLRGTHHRPVESTEGFNRIGILFPNGGVAPRAGFADIAVYWADWLAQRGYPSFRFDLPGLGDSDRDPAAEEIDFQAHADAGGYAPWLSGIANWVVERFDLAGVVVLAHCSGTVTAIFAGAANRRIRGVILLDPYFHLQNDTEIQTLVRSWNGKVIRGLGGGWFRDPAVRAIGVKALSGLRRIYRLFSRAQFLVRRRTLPSSTNLSLIRAWNELTSAGAPILILRSSSWQPKAGDFDYISYLQKHRPRDSQILLKPVSSATHAFAEQACREPVARYAEEWLSMRFSSRESKSTLEEARDKAQFASAGGD